MTLGNKNNCQLRNAIIIILYQLTISDLMETFLQCRPIFELEDVGADHNNNSKHRNYSIGIWFRRPANTSKLL